MKDEKVGSELRTLGTLMLIAAGLFLLYLLTL
jgi:hypothetical protein